MIHIKISVFNTKINSTSALATPVFSVKDTVMAAYNLQVNAQTKIHPKIQMESVQLGHKMMDIIIK
jgi:hypothetical protein